MARRYFYTLLFYVLLPLMVVNLLLRSYRQPAYRQRLLEQLGYVPTRDDNRYCIWLHAVSIGEVMAAQPLIERLLRDYPSATVWLTTTTVTGAATVKRLFATRVRHSYLPYDLPHSLQRFWRRVRPDLLLVMETEIWPNLFATCADYGVPVLLLNARLSARSLRGYQRVQGLAQQTLSYVSWIGARSATDADAFLQLGATAAQVQVCGNIKFALTIPTELPQQATALRATWGNRPVWIAASTHAGEEHSLLQVHQQLCRVIPNLLLVLVPRHPERFTEVRQLCQAQGQTVCRSQAQAVLPDTQILLGDTLGELLLWYACADFAFIGGSLIPQGGHNPLEALALAIPVLAGPYTENFSDIYPALYAANAGFAVADIEQLYAQALIWLRNTQQRLQAGQRGLNFFNQQRHVVDTLMQPIDFWLHQRQPHAIPDIIGY